MTDLKTRIAAWIVLLFGICIWLLTYSTTRSLQKDIEEQLAAQQYSAVSYIASDIEQSVYLCLGALTTIAGEIDAPLIASPAKVQDRLLHRPLLRSLFSMGTAVISTSGDVIAAYPPDIASPAIPYARLEFFRRVMATGTAAVGRPHLDGVTGKPAIGLAAPVRDKSGRIIAVLAGFSSLSDPTLFGPLEQANKGKKGRIVVTAPEYQLVVSSSDPARILDTTIRPGESEDFAKFAGGKYEGSGVAADSSGTEMLISTKRIPVAGWVVEAALPTDEAFAPVGKMKERVYSIALALSLGVALSAWLIIRRMLRPLSETGRQMVAMANGEAALKAIEVNRHDEIGALQRGFNMLVSARNAAEGRVRQLSRLYATMSATNEAIIHGRSIDDVYFAVCRACVDFGDFTTAWIGLADIGQGRIVPAAVCGRHADYIDRIDIRTSAELPQGRGPTGTAYREQRVVIVRNFGRGSDTSLWRDIAETAGILSAISLPLLRNGKPVGVLSAYSREELMQDDEAANLLQRMADNISFALDQIDREISRTRSEDALKASEAALRNAQRMGNIGSWDWDLQSNVVVWSEELYRIIGAPSAFPPPRGKALAAYYSHDDWRKICAWVKRILETGLPHEGDLELRRLDGTRRMVTTRTEAIRNGRGNIVRMRGTIQDITQRKQLLDEIAAQQRRIADHSRHLVAAQEEERRRLALAIHDVVSPNIAAIRIHLNMIANELVGDQGSMLLPQLEDAQAMLQDTESSLRGICTDLRPVSLDYVGFVQSLHEYGKHFSRRTGMEVRVIADKSAKRMPLDLETRLFRIAQEALTNCAKHSEANSIEISWKVEGGTGVLTIADDGVGFDPERLGAGGSVPGLGLLTMRERAEFDGGHFRLESSPGQGTRITVEVAAA